MSSQATRPLPNGIVGSSSSGDTENSRHGMTHSESLVALNEQAKDQVSSSGKASGGHGGGGESTATVASNGVAAAAAAAPSHSNMSQSRNTDPASLALAANNSSNQDEDEQESSCNNSESNSTNRRKLPKLRTYILSDAVFEVEPRYDIKEIVGHGAYGVVCSARDLANNQLVAVKKIENIFEHRSLAKRTLRELLLLRYFKHENIMDLQRVMRPRSRKFNNVYLVSELLETDLACVIRSPQELTDEHCQFFIYQVLRGLKYIHSANVVHRDLKPRNLLVNSNCDLKICDFGLARVDDPHNPHCLMSDYVATRWYRPPEVIISRERYTKAVDMWSVGCILAELIGRKPLFPGRDSFHQITLIISILGTPSPDSYTRRKSRDFVANLPKKKKIPFTSVFKHANPLACDLLERLLTFDPEKRITVDEALKHPYLEELHCEEDEPICENFGYDSFFFEYQPATKEDLRALIYEEAVTHYPEDTFDRDDAGSTTKIIPSFSSSKRKGRRRKSF